MSDGGESVQVVWRLFRDQRERCAGCGVRLGWEERDVRGRSGGWVLAAERTAAGEDVPACVCFRCSEHEGPKTRFYLNLDGVPAAVAAEDPGAAPGVDAGAGEEGEAQEDE